MTPNICENCGATIPGEEQFCPTCGEWVDPLRPAEGQDFESFSLSDPPPDAGPEREIRRQRPDEGDAIPCPSCGTRNPLTNRHCENCGARLAQGALPVAPRPAVQTTAGVRAAIGIAGILLLVILAVTVVNLIGGDGAATGDTTSTTGTSTLDRPDPVPLAVLDVECTVEGIPGFACDNVIDDGEGEYQFNTDTLEEGAEVSISFTFPQAVEIAGLIWENIPEDENDRFLQNYKVQRITVQDDSGPEIPISIDNSPGTLPLNYISPRTNRLVIRITAFHPAVNVGGQQFSDLAIRGIQILGNPAATTGATTGDTTGEDPPGSGTDATTDTTGG